MPRNNGPSKQALGAYIRSTTSGGARPGTVIQARVYEGALPGFRKYETEVVNSHFLEGEIPFSADKITSLDAGGQPVTIEVPELGEKPSERLESVNGWIENGSLTLPESFEVCPNLSSVPVVGPTPGL